MQKYKATQTKNHKNCKIQETTSIHKQKQSTYNTNKKLLKTNILKKEQTNTEKNKNKKLLYNTNESGRRAAPAVLGVCPTCPILSQHNYIGLFHLF